MAQAIAGKNVQEKDNRPLLNAVRKFTGFLICFCFAFLVIGPGYAAEGSAAAESTTPQATATNTAQNPSASTNAIPTLNVQHYEVIGNTVLVPELVDSI